MHDTELSIKDRKRERVTSKLKREIDRPIIYQAVQDLVST